MDLVKTNCKQKFISHSEYINMKVVGEETRTMERYMKANVK
jgi:hypothetical protein